jgi:predicted nucleic acid-binding protein
VIVLDASAVTELVLGTARGRRVAQMLAGGDESLCAPHLLPVEVCSVLRRLALGGSIAAADGEAALSMVFRLGISLYDHEPLVFEAFARRDNLTAYDAVYAVLAEALGARLVTCDAHLARSPGVGAQVVLIDV